MSNYPQYRHSSLFDGFMSQQLRFSLVMGAKDQPANPSLAGQISFTDPHERSMDTSGRGSEGLVYHVQDAVETDHHLVVAHDVVQTGSDLGYYSGDQIKACADAGLVPTSPEPPRLNSRKRDMFVTSNFRYVPEEDAYICSAGETLNRHYVAEEAGLLVSRYWTTNPGRCLLKCRCTTGKERRISCYEYEPLMEAMQQRMGEHPDDVMRLRRETVDHPFGTIKMWMGATHFLIRRLHGVETEMALSFLANSLTWVMNIIGVKPLRTPVRNKTCKTRRICA